MQYIEAVSSESQSCPVSVFLAGGITNCPDWQAEIVRKLSAADLTVVNPRRISFPIDDPDAAQAQIEWEYYWLRGTDIVSVWFSAGSLNPIVLFELGSALERCEHLIVGCDPQYERRQDVRLQTYLRRPELDIVYSLDDLAKAITRKAAWLALRKEQAA
jgi:hypothetical protein